MGSRTRRGCAGGAAGCGRLPWVPADVGRRRGAKRLRDEVTMLAHHVGSKYHRLRLEPQYGGRRPRWSKAAETLPSERHADDGSSCKSNITNSPLALRLWTLLRNASVLRRTEGPPRSAGALVFSGTRIAADGGV